MQIKAFYPNDTPYVRQAKELLGFSNATNSELTTKQLSAVLQLAQSLKELDKKHEEVKRGKQ